LNNISAARKKHFTKVILKNNCCTASIYMTPSLYLLADFGIKTGEQNPNMRKLLFLYFSKL